jgi:ERCC4-type nuclease
MSNYRIDIDIREHGLQQYFSSIPNYKFVNLEVGDIIFYINDEIKLIIERKTISDLYSSIKDGRYREQKARLLNNYPKEKIMYLLEGDVSTNNRRINTEIVYGSITNTLLRDHIRILHSADIAETAKYISLIEKRLVKNPEFFMEPQNGGVATDYATTIKLKKKDNMTPQMCQTLQLAQIPSLSIAKAHAIMEEYGSLYKLMACLDDESAMIELGNIKINDRKLGPKAVEKIREYLC